MKTYLQHTSYNTYKYVRRVPKELLKYISITSFRVSLGSNQLEATQIALSFNNSVKEALQLAELTVSSEMILSKLDGLLPKEKVHYKSDKVLEQGYLGDLAYEYLSSQQDNISVDETRDKRYFYEQVCPAIFKSIGLGHNPKLDDIRYKHLLEFKSIIIQLPKRNIHKYRTMKFIDILRDMKIVQEDEKLSSRTVNKYIKWLRALFNFSIALNHIQINMATSIPLQKTLDDKLQRLPLDNLEIRLLQEAIPQKMHHLVTVLAYTGMRLSELYKCEIVTIDGIKCFSLMDRSIKLKTKSSYRLIPVHNSLLEKLEHFYELRSKVSSDNLAKTTSATIKSLDLKEKNKKSLYSLRHSFATELIQKGADTSIVSELLGHSHTTITLSRYSTGFSIKQLKEVVELL